MKDFYGLLFNFIFINFGAALSSAAPEKHLRRPAAEGPPVRVHQTPAGDGGGLQGHGALPLRHEALPHQAPLPWLL